MNKSQKIGHAGSVSLITMFVLGGHFDITALAYLAIGVVWMCMVLLVAVLSLTVIFMSHYRAGQCDYAELEYLDNVCESLTRPHTPLFRTLTNILLCCWLFSLFYYGYYITLVLYASGTVALYIIRRNAHDYVSKRITSLQEEMQKAII